MIGDIVFQEKNYREEVILEECVHTWNTLQLVECTQANRTCMFRIDMPHAHKVAYNYSDALDQFNDCVRLYERTYQEFELDQFNVHDIIPVKLIAVQVNCVRFAWRVETPREKKVYRNYNEAHDAFVAQVTHELDCIDQAFHEYFQTIHEVNSIQMHLDAYRNVEAEHFYITRDFAYQEYGLNL